VTFNGTLNYTYYRINGSDWINYTVPFSLKTQGIHLLEWTCDSNMSNISSVEIKIDWAPPILSNDNVKWIGLLKWQMSVNASDEVSGVNRVEFGDQIDTEPPYQVILRGCWWLYCLIIFFQGGYFYLNAWDNAGNYLQQPSSS